MRLLYIVGISKVDFADKVDAGKENQSVSYATTAGAHCCAGNQRRTRGQRFDASSGERGRNNEDRAREERDDYQSAGDRETGRRTHRVGSLVNNEAADVTHATKRHGVTVVVSDISTSLFYSSREGH